MNFLAKRLPWRIQTSLGYRPKGELKGKDFLNNKNFMITRGRREWTDAAVTPPVHVEAVLPQEFSIPTAERIKELCSDYFCCSFDNGVVMDSNGIITILRDDLIITPLCADLNRPGLPHRSLSIFEYPPVTRLQGTSISLASNGAYNNYFHFLLELGQKVGFLKGCGIDINQADHVIINKATARYQKDIIKLLGIPEARIVEIQKDTLFVCEKLIVPGHTEQSYFGYEFIRDTVLAQGDPAGGPTPRRIYCSRRSTGLGRAVSNESEVIGLLTRFGFETVYMEDYGVAEQARLMQHCDVFITPHGAAMSNVVFTRPGTKVIELINVNSVVLTFYIYALYAGDEYACLICESVAHPDRAEHMKDIRVDISKLQSLLGKMNIS